MDDQSPGGLAAGQRVVPGGQVPVQNDAALPLRTVLLEHCRSQLSATG